MRFIFFLVLLANVGVLAYGQGFFGIPPSELGRSLEVFEQRNPHAIQLGSPT